MPAPVVDGDDDRRLQDLEVGDRVDEVLRVGGYAALPRGIGADEGHPQLARIVVERLLPGSHALHEVAAVHDLEEPPLRGDADEVPVLDDGEPPYATVPHQVQRLPDRAPGPYGDEGA